MTDLPMPPLAQCPDEYRRVREIRLTMQKQMEDVESYEKALKAHMIANIPKETAGVFGLLYKAQVVTKPAIRISTEGWPAFLAFVRQTGRFDLLQKRINPAAVLELADEGAAQNQVIPGTERFQDVDLSVTKV